MVDALPQIRAALKCHGYEIIQGARVDAQGDIWYRHKCSTSEINHVLYLSYKPKAKAYGIFAGVYSTSVRKTITNQMPDLTRFMVNSSPLNLDSLCWHMFSAGRALDWSPLPIIPLPREPARWPVMLNSLFQEFLEPNFLSINSLDGIKDLLLRDDTPFEWFHNSVLRVAEIAALGRSSGESPQVLRERVDTFSYMSTREIIGDYAECVDSIFAMFS